MQMVRSFQRCGESEMELTLSTVSGPSPTGETRASCDWDGDGSADLGGPDAHPMACGTEPLAMPIWSARSR